MRGVASAVTKPLPKPSHAYVVRTARAHAEGAAPAGQDPGFAGRAARGIPAARSAQAPCASSAAD